MSRDLTDLRSNKMSKKAKERRSLCTFDAVDAVANFLL